MPLPFSGLASPAASYRRLTPLDAAADALRSLWLVGHALACQPALGRLFSMLRRISRVFAAGPVTCCPCWAEVAASLARRLGFGYSQVCSRPPGGAGNRACRRPFQAAVDTEPATHKLGTHFSGFVSRRHRAAKPEKFASIQGGGLKPACSQDWLPHERPKATGELRSPDKLKACPTEAPARDCPMADPR
jgi:hypothetical protein